MLLPAGYRRRKTLAFPVTFTGNIYLELFQDFHIQEGSCLGSFRFIYLKYMLGVRFSKVHIFNDTENAAFTNPHCSLQKIQSTGNCGFGHIYRRNP